MPVEMGWDNGREEGWGGLKEGMKSFSIESNKS